MKSLISAFVGLLLLGWPGILLSAQAVSTSPVCDRRLSESEFSRPLAGEERSRTILQLADFLERLYVSTEVGRKLAEGLRSNLGRRRYATISDGQELAEALTVDLQALANDKHLKVRHRRQEPEIAPAPSAPTDEARAAARARFHRQAAYDGHGIKEVKILSGNIGYLSLGEFWSPAVSGDAVSAALLTLADSDALIVDIRDSYGGHEGVIPLLLGFFLRSPQLLFTTHDRLAGTHRQWWSAEHVPGARRFDDSVRVFVLTSPKTFSAAEMLAIALKRQRQAVLVGEKTKGGAHGGDFMTISCRFDAFIPYYAATIEGGTETWERIGVAPEVAVPSADALRAAHKLALEHLVREGEPLQADPLEQEIRAERLRKISELESKRF